MEEKENAGCGSSCDCCSGCGHGHQDEDMTMEEGVITFTDEEGNDVEFQILDVVSLDEKEYLVVIPCEEDDDEGGVLILEIKQEDGEEVYDTVTDDEEAEKVFQEFKKLNEIDE